MTTTPSYEQNLVPTDMGKFVHTFWVKHTLSTDVLKWEAPKCYFSKGICHFAYVQMSGTIILE